MTYAIGEVCYRQCDPRRLRYGTALDSVLDLRSSLEGNYVAVSLRSLYPMPGNRCPVSVIVARSWMSHGSIVHRSCSNLISFSEGSCLTSEGAGSQDGLLLHLGRLSRRK